MVFFLNDTAITAIYTLSLHDALPIWRCRPSGPTQGRSAWGATRPTKGTDPAAAVQAPAMSEASARTAMRVTCTGDRKSTRLNSSHSQISYAGFCLKKKKKLERNCFLH